MSLVDNPSQVIECIPLILLYKSIMENTTVGLRHVHANGKIKDT